MGQGICKCEDDESSKSANIDVTSATWDSLSVSKHESTSFSSDELVRSQC